MYWHWRMDELDKQTRKLREHSVRLLTAAAALTLAASLAGCSLLPQEEESLKPPLVKPAKEQIELHEAKRSSIVRKLAGVASFEAYQITYYDVAESGVRVSEMKVKSGDTVKPGDLLLRMDDEGLELTRMQRQLDVERKVLQLEEQKQKRDEAQIRIALMELQIAREQLAIAERRLEGRKLYAKTGGVVVYAADLKAGDSVTAYQPIIGIADPSKLRLAYSVTSANDLTPIKVGMDVEVKIGAVIAAGKVAQTPATAPFTTDKRQQEQNAKTLYINLDKLPEGARMGGLADFSITIEKRDNVIVLPNRAIRTYLGRNYVLVLDGESRKEFDIQKGIETPTETEIVKGITEGQKVIIQ